MSGKVVIVGAGPGGLASALLLAQSGHEVTVLERRSEIGGRTSQLREGGFTWDLGPTFFLYPRVLDEILQESGRRLADEIQLERLDPQYRISFGAGGHLDATADVARMEQEIARLCPEDAPGFARFLSDNRGKLNAFRSVLERPFLSWRDLCKPDLLKALPLLRPSRSLNGDLGRFFSDERVRLAFSFQSKYLGMSPFRCPSLFSILSFLEYEYGVYHPVGGCHALMQMLARCAREDGVTIRTGEEVEELEFEGRRVKALRTSNGRYESDAVVLNADFARVMHRLVPERLRRRWSDKKLKKSRYSCSTYMMYLGVDGEVDLPHHTIHISRDYERNLREIEKDHVLSQDPSFYVANPCVTDRTMAPSGKSALYVLVPVTQENPNVDWKQSELPFRELVLDKLSQIGLSDIRERILVEKRFTPADWNQQLEVHLGATFNLSHDLGQMLLLRPRNKFEDLDGVYLSGGGTHPGSGLPVIFESSRIARRLIDQDLGVASSLRSRGRVWPFRRGRTLPLETAS
ncbi:MAG: phytoene desaturase family protein [Planctomycetota bacterium]